MHTLRLAVLVVLVVMAGCGGGDLPHTSDLSLVITPMQATIPVGGTVELSGTASGFTADPTFDWWMQDQHDAGATGSENCDDITYANQELIPTCKFGYLVINTGRQASTTATYHAPQTAGTYHVTLRAYQMSKSLPIDFATKTASATITVTP